MRFEERELKPYAEPVTAGELLEGEVYFSVNFFDDDMLIPEVRPLVFAGRNLEPDDVGTVYFQDVESYRHGVRYDSPKGDFEAVFESGSEREVNHLFHYERALDVLMSCALRRRKTPGQNSGAGDLGAKP